MKKKYGTKFNYIFSTAPNQLIKKNLNMEKTTVVNKENNFYARDIDNLILISNFKNLIISNSTFYYWGALLSEFKNKKVNIICSKKFTNSDTVTKKWTTLN